MRALRTLLLALALPSGVLVGASTFAGPSGEAADPRPTVFSVPLQQAGGWQVLEFRRIRPNVVEFSPAGLRIQVDGSASPLIFPLPKPLKVGRVRARVAVSGRLKGKVGAGSWDEDSEFRLGLVVSGNKRLEGFSKVLAPVWVRKLFALAREGGGVSRIVFLVLGRAPAAVGERRIHPSSELLEERIAWLADGKPGSRVLEAELEPMDEVVALWLSVDGDATGSKYEVLVESIELHRALP
jgi:hypothetical protein